MTDVSITPEDRERLAKTKFGEWFDEFFEKKFSEAFEGAVKARTGGATAVPQQQGLPAQQQGTQGVQQEGGKRRSLLETCLSQTFGF